MYPRSIHVQLVLTGVLALANIASLPLSDGDEPLWIAILDVVLGVVMIAALVPAWRAVPRAMTIELTGLVLAGISAAPGVVFGPSGAKIGAGVFAVAAFVLAGLLARSVGRSGVLSAAR